MKIAIVFDSRTNNTRMLAEAIQETLEDKDIVYFGKAAEDIEADIYFVGSWTDKGCCSEEIQVFLKSLKNRFIAYFETAGFGGSKEYFSRLFDNVLKYIDSSNQVLGSYFCQGKMPESVKKRYLMMLEKNPEDKRIKASLDNFEKAKTHPDDTDLNKVKDWALSMLERIKE